MIRWFKVDCTFATNPKVWQVGPNGWWLYCYLLAWNEMKRCNGFIETRHINRALQASIARVSPEILDETYVECVKAKLIDVDAEGNVLILGDENLQKHGDLSTNRVRKHRLKQRETEGNVSTKRVKQRRNVREDKIREDKRRVESISLAALEEVYERYPKKQGKAKGMKAAAAKVKDAADFERLRAFVLRMENDWRGQDTTYCPQWSTFINQQRWRDEQPLAPSQPRLSGVGGHVLHKREYPSGEVKL